MTCASCIHWDRYDGALSRELGDCRRGPPAISETLLARFLRPPSYHGADPQEVELDLYAASAFPVTHQSSLCGEHEDGHPIC